MALDLAEAVGACLPVLPGLTMSSWLRPMKFHHMTISSLEAVRRRAGGARCSVGGPHHPHGSAPGDDRPVGRAPRRVEHRRHRCPRGGRARRRVERRGEGPAGSQGELGAEQRAERPHRGGAARRASPGRPLISPPSIATGSAHSAGRRGAVKRCSPGAPPTAGRHATRRSAASRTRSGRCRTRGHQVDLAGPDQRMGTQGVAVLDLAGEQPGHRLQPGVRMRRHVHAAVAETSSGP